MLERKSSGHGTNFITIFLLSLISSKHRDLVAVLFGYMAVKSQRAFTSPNAQSNHAL